MTISYIFFMANNGSWSTPSHIWHIGFTPPGAPGWHETLFRCKNVNLNKLTFHQPASWRNTSPRYFSTRTARTSERRVTGPNGLNGLSKNDLDLFDFLVGSFPTLTLRSSVGSFDDCDQLDASKHPPLPTRWVPTIVINGVMGSLYRKIPL